MKDAELLLLLVKRREVQALLPSLFRIEPKVFNSDSFDLEAIALNRLIDLLHDPGDWLFNREELQAELDQWLAERDRRFADQAVRDRLEAEQQARRDENRRMVFGNARAVVLLVLIYFGGWIWLVVRSVWGGEPG